MKTAGVQLLDTSANEERGEMARMSAFTGAMAICDLVKATLGPKGMDKILQSLSNLDTINVTNDGATILKSIVIDNPAARIIVDLSQAQDAEVGDGTTSVAVLCGQLLHEAENLVGQGIHPQTIVKGWHEAVQVALKALEGSAKDNSVDNTKFREDLLNVARTTLNSKVLAMERDHFAEIAVSAVERLRDPSRLDAISIVKVTGGALRESELVDGLILKCHFGIGQPQKIEDAKILIANTSMDADKIKINGAKIETDSPEQLAKIEQAERQKMLTKCDKIAAHKPTLFVNRQLIYNLPEQYFTEHHINSIEQADFAGVERLALVTGGDIVSTFDTPDKVKLGYAKTVESIMIGEDKLIRFTGCHEPATSTVVLRGATQQMLDEAERALHDALCVIASMMTEKRTVYGAGCSEILMAEAVDNAARHTPGKVSLAMEGFARALRQIPTIIAGNAGLDAPEIVASIRAAHAEGKHTYGLDIKKGGVADIAELGITESFRVKRQVLISASEAAEQILRVDEIITCAPARQKR
ncbi:chaperonin, putative [Trichomonas vaginalis G3]|uniref:CCT-beta n=1 Tax=Trichomonas vaginalis (strain ATCC PRA-98 / G3) TaxID=412133 RepID=A2FR60_TRIV3|nr:T-complex protein 1, beta subunit family [Trichomonas vaginalis G3]EAX92612.1 chaperonin, putative [Trichomonas vaginalis G3]KAI5552685.1 T-complex protein 1, beta subunit family [Trichomonas vaginalis G3]|eukprot:XP_001305542.1 chaperonin [Trichomonas vaginalis G3]